MDKVQEDQVAGEEGSTLGSFLSSASEPTITRQLNVLSNIVKRAFLFGGESELRVLAQTLEEEKSAFSDRWYGGEPNTKQVRKGGRENENENERQLQSTYIAHLPLTDNKNPFGRRRESRTLRL